MTTENNVTDLILYLPDPISINAAYATDFKTKRRFKTKKYEHFIKMADMFFLMQKLKGIEGYVHVEYFVFEKLDKRRRDITNYVKILDDILVMRRIIDDDSFIVKSTISWVVREDIISLPETISKDVGVIAHIKQVKNKCQPVDFNLTEL